MPCRSEGWGLSKVGKQGLSISSLQVSPVIIQSHIFHGDEFDFIMKCNNWPQLFFQLIQRLAKLLTIRLAFSLPGRHSKPHGIPTDSSYDDTTDVAGRRGPVAQKSHPTPKPMGIPHLSMTYGGLRGDLHFKTLTFSVSPQMTSTLVDFIR